MASPRPEGLEAARRERPNPHRRLLAPRDLDRCKRDCKVGNSRLWPRNRIGQRQWTSPHYLLGARRRNLLLGGWIERDFGVRVSAAVHREITRSSISPRAPWDRRACTRTRARTPAYWKPPRWRGIGPADEGSYSRSGGRTPGGRSSPNPAPRSGKTAGRPSGRRPAGALPRLRGLFVRR